MKILIVGDTHGNVSTIAYIDQWCANHGIDVVFQVGDFGIHWPGQTCRVHQFFHKKARKERPGPTWYTCGGNHDNYVKLEALNASQEKRNVFSNLIEYTDGCYYVKRTESISFDGMSFLFFGGTESTDAAYRTPGLNWWAAETPTEEEFQLLFDNWEKHKPDVIISHEAPTSVRPDRAPGLNPHSGYRTNHTSHHLQRVMELTDHQPTLWFYGHHHSLIQQDHYGTRFQCCGINPPQWTAEKFEGVLLDTETGLISSPFE